jgi:hypothetical protein
MPNTTLPTLLSPYRAQGDSPPSQVTELTVVTPDSPVTFVKSSQGLDSIVTVSCNQQLLVRNHISWSCVLVLVLVCTHVVGR